MDETLEAGDAAAHFADVDQEVGRSIQRGRILRRRSSRPADARASFMLFLNQSGPPQMQGDARDT